MVVLSNTKNAIIIILTISSLHSDAQMEPFVANGHDAKIVDFSFSAFFIVNSSEVKGLWLCGSSIVTQELIMTAAHCAVDIRKPSDVTFFIGHEIFKMGALNTALDFIAHEDYHDSELNNDIAMIRLETPLRFGDRISRIALLPKPPYKEKAVMAGWGVLDEKLKKPSPKLQFTEQYVWKRKDCLKILGFLYEGTFCAQNKGCMLSASATGYINKGDSGSPLVVRGYIQIGIVSYKLLHLSKSLAVYTDTGHFYNWIIQTAAKLCEGQHIH